MAFYGSGYIQLTDGDIFIDPVRADAAVNTFVRGLGVPATLPTQPAEDGQLYVKAAGYSSSVGAGFLVTSQRLVYRPGVNVITGHNEIDA